MKNNKGTVIYLNNFKYLKVVSILHKLFLGQLKAKIILSFLVSLKYLINQN